MTKKMDFAMCAPPAKLSDIDTRTLGNLRLLSKLFSPEKCADTLDAFFIDHPGAFAPFCDMLLQEDRDPFLIKLCQNAIGFITTDLQSQATMQKQIEEGKAMILGLQMPHDVGQMNFMYVLLRQCSRAIPEHEEYLDLKNRVSKNGYYSLPDDSLPNFKKYARRIRLDEDENSWVLEEAAKFYNPGEPDNWDWKEIDRG